jgi:acetyltransferase
MKRRSAPPIAPSVFGCRESSAPDQFSGVTVQPMVKFDGYDLILGSSVDPQFGPVILFGSGGLLVDVYGDHALALPPLNTTWRKE